MAKKLGNGGHGPEEYDETTGKYVSDGEAGYHPNGSGDLTRGQIDNPVSVNLALVGVTEEADNALDEYNDWALESIMKETGYGYADALYFQDRLQEYLGGDFRAFTMGHRPAETQVVDEGLSRMAKYNGGVYRGMSYDKGNPEEMAAYNNLIKNLKVGNTFATNNLSSWSSEKAVGQSYADWDERNRASVFFMIRPGKNKSGVGVKHISKFGDVESEVLFPSTARFKVVSNVMAPKIMAPGQFVNLIVLEEI